MAYNFGILNFTAFLRAKQWLKSGSGKYTAGKPPMDNAIDNNYQNYADNSAGTGAIPTFKECNASQQFEVTAGHTLVSNSLTLNAVAVPATPTGTVVGTAGSTSYTYKVVGRAGSLQAPSATVTKTTGNATLTSSNYITITFTPTPGFLVYDIYRTASAGTPSTTGRIGTVNAAFGSNISAPTLTFNDTGLTADGSTSPTANTTGAITGDLSVYGNVNVNALATPAAPLATVTGTAGTTSITYKIVARSGSPTTATGHTAASTGTAVTTANATLSASNYVNLVWQPVPGAVSYDVYRTATNGTSPTTTGLIGNTVTTAGFNDTGLAGDSATAPTTNTTGNINQGTSSDIELANIFDTSGNPEMQFVATTSAVNGVVLTNSATGNPVNVTPGAAAGSDTNIGLTLNSKGTGAVTIAPTAAGGTVVVGTTTQTGTITVGQSTATNTVSIGSGNPSAATQTVSIGNGAAVTSGGVTVNVAAGVPGASTANTVHLGDGGTTTGTVAVTLGSIGNAAHTTAIQGGSGATAITLFPQITGTVTVGAAAGTGDVVIGSSSTTQSVKIGNGAGVATVNIANISVAGANANIACAVTGAGVTDTVTISGGNAAATGIKVVNILTGTAGTSGNNRATIGGGATSAVTLNAAVSSYTASNYIATESGANNALVAALLNSSGAAVTVAAGLCIYLKLAHTLQAGANTLNLNSHGTDSIKKASNPATDLSVTAASGSILMMIFDGTVWQAQGQ